MHEHQERSSMPPQRVQARPVAASPRPVVQRATAAPTLVAPSDHAFATVPAVSRIQRKAGAGEPAAGGGEGGGASGLPAQLKTGIEALSGLSVGDIKVHYNSDKPAQLQALAYAQGSDIHLAPGQEQHLPHEAWHVVQQKQGRVKPTMHIQGDPGNDAGLEQEADTMGGRAAAGDTGPAQA